MTSQRIDAFFSAVADLVRERLPGLKIVLIAAEEGEHGTLLAGLSNLTPSEIQEMLSRAKKIMRDTGGPGFAATQTERPH